MNLLKVHLLRSSWPDVFCTKDVIKNVARFTGEHTYQSLFFNKVPVFNLQLFFCEFYANIKTTFFTEHLRATASKLVVKM